MYEDLRAFIAEVDALGALRRVDGADPKFELGGITITYNRLWIIVFTLAVFALLLALLRFTRLGLEMRAVTQNRAMAASMGIRTARVERPHAPAAAFRERLSLPGSRGNRRCSSRRRPKRGSRRSGAVRADGRTG
jgi:hypothetical protein